MSRRSEEEQVTESQQPEEQAPEKQDAAAESTPYIAKVVTPSEEPPQAEPPAEETRRIEVPEGEVAVVYRGLANVVTHGEYRFRNGEPVTVPSEVAEELLSFPFEPFELLEPQQEE
jgi:hypothetical protein